MEGFRTVFLLAGVVCQITAAPQPLLSTAMSAALTASGLGPLVPLVKLATDTQTLGKAMDLGGNVTRFATYMVKNASEAGSSVARVGLSQSTDLGGKALSGGIGVGKQAVSFFESAAKHVPGGQMMSVIAPVANVGLDMAGKVGGIGLEMTSKGGDKILHVGNQVVQHKAELVNTSAQKLIGAGRTAVNKMDSVKNTINSISGLSSIGGLTSAFGSRLSSAASGLTSAVSGSASASGGVSASTSTSSGLGLSGRFSFLG